MCRAHSAAAAAATWGLLLQGGAAYWPRAEVETTRLMPTPSSTTIRPAQAIRPLVPSL